MSERERIHPVVLSDYIGQNCIWKFVVSAPGDLTRWTPWWSATPCLPDHVWLMPRTMTFEETAPSVHHRHAPRADDGRPGQHFYEVAKLAMERGYNLSATGCTCACGEANVATETVDCTATRAGASGLGAGPGERQRGARALPCGASPQVEQRLCSAPDHRGDRPGGGRHSRGTWGVPPARLRARPLLQATGLPAVTDPAEADWWDIVDSGATAARGPTACQPTRSWAYGCKHAPPSAHGHRWTRGWSSRGNRAGCALTARTPCGACSSR